ncbi:MAG: PQQ-dependent sugar dehydrogenase [Bryobacteraceae bacterium]
MKQDTLLLVFAALASAGTAPAFQQMAAKLPPPFATPSANNRPQVISRPNGAQLEVPAGFTVAEYATGFQTPRVMIYGPSGELLLTESLEGGGVSIIAVKGKLLEPGERKKLISGLERPYGLAWYQDWLYVGESSSIKRYKYDAKAMTVGKGEEVVSLAGLNRGHWTRSLAIDPKAKKLYVGVGSASNVSPGEPKERAAINRYNLDGTGYETFASGTRNPTSIHFYPGTEQLWASVQERDALGDDLVPDYFTHIQQGGFYGWPFAYFGPNEDPRNKGQQPDLVKKTITPDVSLGAHVAVIDWTFYTGKMFPKEYQGGAFLALHGSWNRSIRVGQSVAFVPFQNGKPTAPPKEFLKGWMLSPDKAQVWGRPTGVLQMTDGSLLVSDDGGNKIWRISYKQ